MFFVQFDDRPGYMLEFKDIDVFKVRTETEGLIWLEAFKIMAEKERDTVAKARLEAKAKNLLRIIRARWPVPYAPATGVPAAKKQATEGTRSLVRKLRKLCTLILIDKAPRETLEHYATVYQANIDTQRQSNGNG
jgi:hypothetical protein